MVLLGEIARSGVSIDAIYSTALCVHVRAIEALTNRPVAVLVLVEGPAQLAFAFPGQLGEAELVQLLRAVAAASQDALKSL